MKTVIVVGFLMQALYVVGTLLMILICDHGHSRQGMSFMCAVEVSIHLLMQNSISAYAAMSSQCRANSVCGLKSLELIC